MSSADIEAARLLLARLDITAEQLLQSQHAPRRTVQTNYLHHRVA